MGFVRLAPGLLPLTPINARIMYMRKLFLTAACTLTVGILMLGTIAAQRLLHRPRNRPRPPNPVRPLNPLNRNACTAIGDELTGPDIENRQDKLSYAIGMNIGQSMKKIRSTSIRAVLPRGIKDALYRRQAAHDRRGSQDSHDNIPQRYDDEKQAKAQQAGDANKLAGQNSWRPIRPKKAWSRCPAACNTRSLKAGDRAEAHGHRHRCCNYRGTLIDGTEFDSSYKSGEPATFPVRQVIKGWTEALQLMPVGSKWQLFIPLIWPTASAAQAREIGPNSTLIFEIELLSIQEKKPAEKQ